MTFSDENVIFGTWMCVLEQQQPKENCKMNIGWKIGSCTCSELFSKLSKGNVWICDSESISITKEMKCFNLF